MWSAAQAPACRVPVLEHCSNCHGVQADNGCIKGLPAESTCMPLQGEQHMAVNAAALYQAGQGLCWGQSRCVQAVFCSWPTSLYGCCLAVPCRCRHLSSFQLVPWLTAYKACTANQLSVLSWMKVHHADLSCAFKLDCRNSALAPKPGTPKPQVSKVMMM